MALPMLFPYSKVYPAQLEAMLDVRRAALAGERALVELPLSRQVTLLATLLDASAKKLLWVARTPRARLEVLYILEDLRVKAKARDANFRLLAAPWLSLHPCATQPCQVDMDDAIAGESDRVWFPDALEGACAKAKICLRQTCLSLAARARVLVLDSHEALLDPKLAFPFAPGDDCIVVIDDAVQLDSTLQSVMSVHLNRALLEAASRDFIKLCTVLDRPSATLAERLDAEYGRLVTAPAANDPASPLLSPLSSAALMPGNLRRHEHFCQLLGALLGYFKAMLEGSRAFTHTPTRFLFNLCRDTFVDAEPLKFVHARFARLLDTVGFRARADVAALSLVCEFVTLLATADASFRLVFEPVDVTCGFKNPVLQLACLDARSVLRARTADAHAVFVAASSFSAGPTVFSRLLGLQSHCARSLKQTVRVPVWPVIVDRSADQTTLASALDEAVLLRHYLALLVDVCATVPDGVVVFWKDYVAMERALQTWHDAHAVNALLEHKLIFAETLDVKETATVLDEYASACDCGRGALLFTYARGKVAEAARLGNCHARARVLLGFPSEQRAEAMQARTQYQNVQYEVPAYDLHAYEAVKAAMACAPGNVLGSHDWSVLVLADAAWVRPSVRSKLPRWISDLLDAQPDRGVRSQDVFAADCRVFVKQAAVSSFTKLQGGAEVAHWVRRIEAERAEERRHESELAARDW